MDRRSARAGALDRKVRKQCACCGKKKPFRRSQWSRRTDGKFLCADCTRMSRDVDAAVRAPAPRDPDLRTPRPLGRYIKKG